MEALIARLTEWGTLAIAYVSEPSTVYQFGMIVVFYVIALVLSWRIEPKLEARARLLKVDKSLLRVVIAFMRRLEWVMFVALLAVGVFLMRTFEWPGTDYLVFTALVLSLAWLVISVLSHTIRSRAIGRIIAIGGWSYVALVVLGVTEEAAVLLDAAGFAVGKFRISMLLVLKLVVFLGALLWIAVSFGTFLDSRLQRSEELTPSLRVLIGKILKIVLIIVAALVGMSGLGIDLTVFTVLSGAIGVGIGFGLQKVVSNFISGIIILMDQSIKPGDTITLGDTFGWIRELRARFVSVVTRDGREYLIPNEDFITREVVNWSFSDDLVRLDVPFGVAYDSDPHRVTELAIEAAIKCPRVVSSNKPVCWLTGFGDSSLDFVLRFWIDDPRNGLTNIRGIVLLALWDTFKENGIKIPYPHREVIMRQPGQ